MERKMRNGELLVRTRQVPGYASLQISAQFKQPDPPKVKIHSVAGHDEVKDAPIDSPEWAEYARQAQEVEKKAELARADFLYDYAVEAWSWDDGINWITDAHDKWTFPDVLLRHGIQPSLNRRVDYIRYELITSNEDMSVLFADALGNTAPITDAEVDAASAGFRVDKGRDATSQTPAKRNPRLKWTLFRNDNSKKVGKNS